MSDRLARFGSELLTSGVFPDMANQNAPFWRTANNITFYAGAVMPFPGATILFPKSFSNVITGLLELDPQITGYPAICYGTDAKLYLWDAVNGETTEGTGYTGRTDQTSALSASRWSMVQWNTWVYATNGKDKPQVNKAGAGFADADVDTLFTTAEIFYKWRQFLIAFNLSTGKNHIRHCDTDNSEVWTPSATNRARGLFAQDIVEIIAVRGMGESILFYGPESLHQLEFLGSGAGSNVFGAHRLLTGIGAVGKNAVTSGPDGLHYGVGPRGIWRTDGNSAEYIDGPAVRRYFHQTLNHSQTSKIACSYNGNTKHIVISYPSPTSTENDLILALNLESSPPKWVPCSFGRSVMSDAGKFTGAISGGRTGDIYLESMLEPVSGALGNPNLQLNAVTSTFTLGYGEAGYGDLGYGGYLSDNG